MNFVGVDFITKVCLLFDTRNLLDFSWLEIKNKNINLSYTETAFIRNRPVEVYFLA